MSASDPKRTFRESLYLQFLLIRYQAAKPRVGLVSVAATGCTIYRHQIRRGRCFVLRRRPPIVRCLLSGRRHADARSAVRRAAMRELLRTNLGGEKVACRTG